MKTTFILKDSEALHIIFLECDCVLSTLESCMSWCITQFPFLSKWETAMEWTLQKGENTLVFLHTKTEGYKTISIDNSVLTHSFHLPKPDTYNNLTLILRLLLKQPTLNVPYRINHLGNFYQLASDSIVIHEQCYGIYLDCTDDFYVLLQGVSLLKN